MTTNYFLYEAMDRLSVQLSQLEDCLSPDHRDNMSLTALKHLEAAMEHLCAAYKDTAGRWHDEEEHNRNDMPGGEE